MVTVLHVDGDKGVHACLPLLLPPAVRLLHCFTDADPLCSIASAQPDLVLVSAAAGRGLSNLVENLARTRVPVVVLGEADSGLVAVEVMRAGAVDFLPLPLRHEQLCDAVRRCVLLWPVPKAAESSGLVGRSSAIQRVRREIELFGPGGGPVLITGESGTGKELVAKALYETGGRGRVFISRNCGAIPEALFESEFFGSERGAYTGAVSRRGILEAADGGTLFLDEIGEVPISCQAKLLRLLEEGTVTPLGSCLARRARVRIIAATNRALKRLVADGRFREDLYYRLNVLRMSLPALRDRREDIPFLLESFLHDLEPAVGLKRLTPAGVEKAMAYDWPGNIRELRNVAERAAYLCSGPWIGPSHIFFD